jgi:hypothetical protein
MELKTLIQAIRTSALEITNIQEVYAYPLQSNPKKYPAIIFYPTATDNSFETTDENFVIYTFELTAVIDIAGLNVKDVWEKVLPQTYDDIHDHFAENWNMGTVDGHRVWARVSASNFGMSIEQKNKTAGINMLLQIKTLKDN